MEGGSAVIVNRRDNFRGNYLGRKRGTVNYYDGGGGSVSREKERESQRIKRGSVKETRRREAAGRRKGENREIK